MHGLRDDDVPFEVVAPYIDKAGDSVDALIFEDEGHFDVIDPASPSWEATLAHLAGSSGCAGFHPAREGGALCPTSLTSSRISTLSTSPLTASSVFDRSSTRIGSRSSRRASSATSSTRRPRGRVWNRDEHGRVTFYDSQVWQEIPEYRDFVENSPMAELAGRVMNVEAVNFFFDAIFTAAPGASSARRSTRTSPTGRSKGSTPARRGCRSCRSRNAAPSSS